MFSLVSIIGLMMLATVACRLTGGEAPPPRINEPMLDRLPWWERILYALLLLCAAVLALTGFGTFVLTGGKAMTGLVLMLHATVAPPFVILVTITAVVWAERSRLMQFTPGGFSAGIRVLFWLMILLSLLVILSAVFPMTPLFGTHGQELLYRTHQYSSLLLTLVMILQAYGLWTR